MEKKLIAAKSLVSQQPAWLQFALTAFLINGALILASKISVPFWPVPFSLQTFACLMFGIYCRPSVAAAGVALYIIEGISGLPVNVPSVAPLLGFSFLTAPTAGYILGFFVTAVFVSLMKKHGFGHTWQSALFTTGMGAFIILALGVAWLSVLIGFDKAIISGFLYFIPGDLLKAVIAAPLLMRAAKK